MITLESRVQRATHHLDTRVSGELVLLDAERDKFIALNDIGTEIWDLLATPITVGEVCDELRRRFDVSPERSATEVLSFLGELESRALLVVVSGAA